MSCPNAESCPLFQRFTQNSLLQFWKDRYCNIDDRWPECERYKMNKKGKPVPITLMPNGTDLSKRGR